VVSNITENFILMGILYGLLYSSGVVLFKIVDDKDYNLLRKVLKR